MIAAEEEQFVFDDRAANDAAVLIALEGVALRREEVSGVEHAVADEFENVAVKLISSRLGHRVNGGRRVITVLSLDGAGFELELLEGVRKR